MDDPTDRSWEKQSGGFNDVVRGIPIAGNIFGGAGVKTSAETNKQRAMQRVLQLLAQYRPEQLQFRQNALDNAMKLFEPVNRALVNAYGSGAALPIQAATRSPIADQAMASMRAAGAAPKTLSRVEAIKQHIR